MFSRENSLSNFDIMKRIQSQRVNDFKGVYTKDQLPDKIEQGSYVIILQSLKGGNGTHWVYLYHTPIFSCYDQSFVLFHHWKLKIRLFPICIMIYKFKI